MELSSNPDLICLMFVRALLQDRRNSHKPSKNGPMHAPVVIYEDLVVDLDYDVLRPSNVTKIS